MPDPENLIEQLAKTVDGANASEDDILIFTLSTCQWCKKCKRFLDDNNMKYRYIDVDLIDYSDKAILLDYLRENYDSRVSYPFLICKKGHVVGYDPNRYVEMLGGAR